MKKEKEEAKMRRETERKKAKDKGIEDDKKDWVVRRKK